MKFTELKKETKVLYKLFESTVEGQTYNFHSHVL